MAADTGVGKTVIPLRILFFDLETAPLLAHVWSAYADYVGHEQMLHDSFLLTWSAKWGDQKRIISARLTTREAQDQDDTRIVAELADLIREADIIIAHNVDRFDLPMFNNRLLLLGLEPLGPVQTIDTLKLAKSSFRLAYNKLDYLAYKLGLGKKIKTDFNLWRQAYLGSETALAKMERYNRRDVQLLEQVFEKLKPYVKKLPRMVDGSGVICPVCGSDHYQKRGTRYHRTNAFNYQRFQCQNCGRYFRLKKAEPKSLETRPI